MATDESKIIVKLEAEVGKLTTELNRAQKKISGFEKNTSKAAKRVRASFDGLDRKFKIALGGITLGLAAKLSDTFTEINSRLKLVTNSTDEFARAQDGVFSIAQRTRQSFSATAELYQRLAQSTESLGIEQSELLKITDTVNKAIAVSGASSQAAQAAIVQLGQGLSAGALRGEEFNSVVEQTPRLAKALADGLGVGIGELREMAKQGQLTSNVVIQALQNQAEAIEGDFASVGATIGQALQTLENAFVKIIGGAGEASGAQRDVTSAIIDFSEELNSPEMQAGINTIAVAAVDAFKTLTKAVAGTVEAVKDFSESFAARLNGPSDLGRINERIAQLQALVDQLDMAASKTSAPDVYNLYVKQINEAEAELKKLIDLRDSYFKKPELVVSNAPEAVTPSAGKSPSKIKPIVLPGGTEKETPYERLNKSLRENIELFGQSTKAAEVDFQIRNKLLGDLSAADELVLRAQAEKFDMLQKESELAKQVEKVRLDSLTDEQRAVEDLQNQYKTLAEAVQAGNLSQEAAAQIAGELAKRYQEAGEDIGEMSEFAKQAARNMQDAFADFLFDPFDQGLEGMLSNFGRILQRMAAEAAAAQIFDYIGGVAAASGNPYVAAAGALFQGGGRANGGPVMAGMAYPVGEKGPELFMPNVAGTIIPNDMLEGGGMQVGNMNFVFPNVTNAQEAKRAGGAAGREAVRAIDGARRYS